MSDLDVDTQQEDAGEEKHARQRAFAYVAPRSKISCSDAPCLRAKPVELEVRASSPLKEMDSNLVAQWLENFFRDIYGQPPENWTRAITDTLLFPLARQPPVVKAVLYGNREPARFVRTQTTIGGRLVKQDWFRWVRPLFEYSLALSNDVEPEEIKSSEVRPIHTTNEFDSTGVVFVVQLLNWAFQNEQTAAFTELLKEIKVKFELLGWTEQCALRVGTIYKAFIAKVSTRHIARLRTDHDFPGWDNLITFIGAVEDFVFFSPTYGFAAKPGPNLVGVHTCDSGCADAELLALARELLCSLLQVGAATTNVQDEKENPKTQQALKSCSQFLEAACKYTIVLKDSLEIAATFEDIDAAQLSNSVNELVEALARRPRFAKANKRQAIKALQEAVTQKSVAMMDPWGGIQVLSSESPETQLVPLSERWQEQRAVVYLVRRFGCPLCLHQASMLMNLKPALDEHGVKLIAVGNGDYNLARQFKEGLPWLGEVYLDPGSASFKAIQLKRLTKWEVVKRYFSSLRVINWFSNNPHQAQNQDGDGFQTGGVFVLGPGEGSRVTFSFREIDNDPLSFALPEAILNACTADKKKQRRVMSVEIQDID